MGTFQWKNLFILVTVVGLLVSSAPAQTAQGRISGTVADPGGAVIPGASVIAVDEETGVSTSATSNHVGLYVLPFLKPGRYSITCSAQGFKRYERTGLIVETSQVMGLNITMELGAVTETVTVAADAPLLQGTQSGVDQFIDSRAVNDMPLAGRRALELVKLSSETVFVNYSGGAKPQFAISGGRSYKSAYVLDGGNIQNLRMASLQVEIDPPVEVIKEFKVVQNGYAAEYGGSASGVLISTTKSGTNEFHGSAFEFLRNDAFDASGFFAPAEGGKKVKAPLRYNLFGGTIGGPIIRNRTHFFFGYEGTRRSDGSTQVLTLADARQQAGDFSRTVNSKGSPIPIYDPMTNVFKNGKTIRTPFVNNVIPQGRLDPVSLALREFWPSPNRLATNLAGAQNFAGNRSNKFTRDNITTRIDHVFSDSNRLFFRFVFNDDPYSWTSNYPGNIGDPQAPFSPKRWETSYYVNDSITVSPNLITEIGYSFSNRTWVANSAGLGSGIVSKIGLPNVSNDAFPEIRVTGIASLGSGMDRTQNPIRQHQVTNSWTWIKGNHVLKFGGEVRKGINVDINRPITSGNFSFSPTGTGLPGNAATGIGYASYLLGFVNGFSTRETELLDRYSYYLAGFAQDDWKISNDLTLNIGLRWETDTALMDKNDRSNSFDRYAINPVSGTPGVVKFAGVDGWPEAPYGTDWNNFGPRFGFAWKPFGSQKSVIRGGYGIFFEGPSTSANAASLGFELSGATSSPDNGVTPAFYLRNGPDIAIGKAELNDAFGAVPFGKRASTNVSFYEQNRRTGYAQHLNLGFQREIAHNMIVEVRYTGNMSRKLPTGNMQINQVPIENAGPGNAQVKRPYPQFNSVTVLSPTIGSNNYHSGTARIEKRYSGGLAFTAGYTWSRAIGDTVNTNGGLGEDQTWQDIYNRRLDKGPDALDIIHRFVWSSTYDLPFGNGRRWLADGLLSKIVGGWTVGSIASLQSGGPFTVTTSSNTTNVFSAGAQRANLIDEPNLAASERSVERWFNTDAFEAPPAYTFGNAGRGIVRGDGRVNFDFSINKNFYFTEQRYVQFRGDLFNSFNHPDFVLPNHTLGNANFGTIGGSTDGRTIQLGLRIVF